MSTMETDMMGMQRNIPLRTNQRCDGDGWVKSTHQGPRGVQIFTALPVVPIGCALGFVAGFNMVDPYSNKGVLEEIVMSRV